jgi:tetratricopeptide (TPR) repeat protein
MADVFISYAAEDRETARRLAEHIAKAGRSVWWDRRLLPGSRFSRLIQRELQEAAHVLVLWSASSVESEWVEIEAGYARQQGKLVPALIEDVGPRVPLEFAHVHAANLAGWSGDGSHPELLSLLEAIAAGTPVPHPAPAASSHSAAEDGAALVRKGHAAFQRREFQEALTLFESALSYGVPQDLLAEAHTSLGNTYSELDRQDDAMAEHRRALEVDPGYHKAWVNLGITHRLKGDLEQAKHCYERAIDLAPDYAQAYASLGVVYINQGDSERAVDTLRRAISLDSQLPVTHANLAVALAGVGDFDHAEKSLSRAVELGYWNEAAVRGQLDAMRRTS